MCYDIYPIEVCVELRLQEARRAAAQERLACSVANGAACHLPMAGWLAKAQKAVSSLLNLAPSMTRTPPLAR